MFVLGQNPRHDAQPSPPPDPDSDSGSATRTDGMRKRQRSSNESSDEPAPLTVACDQCRLRKVRCDRLQPECSNCRKSGAECSSSNTIRRVNHTQQLRHEFSVVLKHLDHVDETLGTLTKLTRQIAAAQSRSSDVNQQSARSSDDDLTLPRFEAFDSTQASAGHESPPPDCQTTNEPLCETIEFDQGSERLYSYPAPPVLIRTLLRQINGPLLASHEHVENPDAEDAFFISRALQDPVTKAIIRQKLDDFPFNTPCPESVASGDMNPVTTPPRLMVNLFVDGFLRNINTRTPIFNDVELRSAIDVHYNAEQPMESRAWALIANNIVLLELGLEILSAHASHSNSHGMNDGILPPFLRNCDRAIGNLDAFMVPTVANVQALLTLTLAAREFYNAATAERVCNAACQVGRALGLHRSKALRQRERNSDSHGSAEQRERLYRVLYTMDKQRVFMTGQPCDLLLADSDHQIGPGCGPGQADRSISHAFNDMMMIWEEIYSSLYTPRAVSAGNKTRARNIQLVTSSMDRFTEKHADLLASSFVNDTSDINPLHMELVYGYRVSQILVLRCQRSNEQSQHKMYDLARSSLGLLLEVGKEPPTTARLALLASMFRNYPMVAFIELVAFHLAFLFKHGEYDSAAQTDVSLLRAICTQLQVLQYDNLTYIFYTRLKLGLSWAIDTLDAVGEALLRPTAQAPQRLARVSLQSTTSSSSSSSSGSHRDSRGSSASPHNHNNHSINGLHNTLMTDMSSASTCAFGALPQTRQSEEDATKGGAAVLAMQNGLAELTNFGLFTPNTDRVDVSSRSLSSSSAGQSGSGLSPFSTTAAPGNPSLMGLTPGPILNNAYWGDFNMDFFQNIFPTP